MKIIVPLSLALLLSVALNLALLRRHPPATPPTPPLPPARALPAARSRLPAPASPSPALPSATSADEALLRWEIQSLKVQLAVAQASAQIDRFPAMPKTGSEHPDARDFQQLRELVDASVEFVEVQAIDTETRKPVTVQKPIVTPTSREQALVLMEDYAGLEPKRRQAFHERALEAIARYRRIQDVDAEENRISNLEVERLRELDQSEEAQACADRASQRSTRRYDDWVRAQVGPLRAMLDAQDGVRPALLSRHLSDLLLTIGSPDER
jgi:hypothetical protein